MITQEQRELRRRYLGSSDIPVILGMSPFQVTPTDIFWSKKRETPDRDAPWLSIGDWLEGPLVQWAAEELGVQVITDHKKLFAVAEEGEGAGICCANHDALIFGKRSGIEAKFANGDNAQEYGEQKTDQVPHHVLIQCQHQCYVSGLDDVWVSVAVPSYYGIDRRLYHVTRDDALISTIVTKGVAWWDTHVLQDVPPDGNPAPPLEILKAIERHTPQIMLPISVAPLINDRLSIDVQMKSLEGRRDELNRQLLHSLGDAEIGILPDGTKVSFKHFPVTRFDSKRLSADHPDIYAQYTYEGESNTGVRIAQAKPSKKKTKVTQK